MKNKNHKIKQNFANKVKNQGITMSTLFLTFMEEYVKDNIKIWLISNAQSREHEIEYIDNPPKNIQDKIDKIAKISKTAKSNK